MNLLAWFRGRGYEFLSVRSAEGRRAPENKEITGSDYDTAVEDMKAVAADYSDAFREFREVSGKSLCRMCDGSGVYSRLSLAEAEYYWDICPVCSGDGYA